MNEENTLDMYVDSVEDLDILILADTKTVRNFFDESFVVTESTATVINVEWYADLEFAYFASDRSSIT